MANYKKSKRKILSSILWIYIFGSLVSFYFLYQGNQSIRQLNNSQSITFKEKQDSLKEVLGIFNELIVVDEFFIQGQYDSASSMYNSLLESENKRLLLGGHIALRQQQLLDMESSKDSIFKDLNTYRFLLNNARKNNDTLTSQVQRLEHQVTIIQEKHEIQVAELKNTIQEQEKQLSKKDKVQVISFRNEKGNLIHYLGEVKDGMANGGGVGIFDTGGIYKGEWKNNQRHGKGTYEWKDGHKYEGEFVNGEREGQGTYLWSSGEKYVGQWRGGKRNGQGTLFDKDNNVSYEGLWEDDRIKK